MWYGYMGCSCFLIVILLLLIIWKIFKMSSRMDKIENSLEKVGGSMDLDTQSLIDLTRIVNGHTATISGTIIPGLSNLTGRINDNETAISNTIVPGLSNLTAATGTLTGRVDQMEQPLNDALRIANTNSALINSI